jgi:hypothetical protein
MLFVQIILRSVLAATSLRNIRTYPTISACQEQKKPESKTDEKVCIYLLAMPDSIGQAMENTCLLAVVLPDWCSRCSNYRVTQT